MCQRGTPHTECQVNGHQFLHCNGHVGPLLGEPTLDPLTSQDRGKTESTGVREEPPVRVFRPYDLLDQPGAVELSQKNTPHGQILAGLGREVDVALSSPLTCHEVIRRRNGRPAGMAEIVENV